MSTTRNPDDPDDSGLDHNTLHVDDDGFVQGEAFTFNSHDGCDVTAHVFSYEYQRRGETKMNHVPMATMTDPSGAILHESPCHDSEYPEKAIERAVSAAEWLIENPEQFME